MTCLEHRSDDVNKKRKASISRSLSYDHEFVLFLQGAFDTATPEQQEDPAKMAEFVKGYASQLAAAPAPSSLPPLAPFAGSSSLQHTSSVGLASKQEASGEQCQPQQTSHQLQQSQPCYSNAVVAPNHRAVTTGMPLPHTSSAAAAVAAAENNADTTSAATMPMPHKRRRTAADDEEVTSSPNDLVEVPSTAVVTTAAGQAARKASASAGGPASSAQSADTAAAATADTAKAAEAAAAGAGKSADAVFKKAILVSKVLTKSDANSKRIILPRIAVEHNLPQLAHTTAFNLSATDPHGQSWPLVIKAWANGQNPKPVYVLEQVGELLKLHRLSVGDAVALLASPDGKFYLEWNNEAARAAAARPTYSGITFDSKPQQQQKAGDEGVSDEHQQQKVSAPPPADQLTAGHRSPRHPHQQQVGEQVQQQQQQQGLLHQHQQQQLQQQTGAAAQELQPPQFQLPHPVVKREVQQQLPPPAPVFSAPAPQQRQQQQQLAVQVPATMSVVHVTPTPFVSGTFIPTSPCQLLVMGDGGAPYFKMEEAAPSLPSSMLVTRSDAAMELPEADVLVMTYGLGGTEGSGELLSGAFLQCPRTPGCSRPAGHQGWCLGHKGYKKRRV